MVSARANAFMYAFAYLTFQPFMACLANEEMRQDITRGIVGNIRPRVMRDFTIAT